MNGAQVLIQALTAGGVDVCFTNPGTSEMHFVAALDTVPGMRAVLGLFEGVVTGAADGYGRMADKPAATLLHLGPGLGNGLANLHNARRARTPIVNIVGDHATYHKQYDAPLESDIDAIAGSVSGWVRRSMRPEDIATDAAEAVAAARRGMVATLILPADVSWGEVDDSAYAIRQGVASAPGDAPDAIAALTSGEPTAILIGGAACREAGLLAASRVANATGAKLICETFPARIERGAGLPNLERLGYFAEFAVAQLGDIKHLVLIGAGAPVSFFAYPGKPSELVPPGCTVHELAPELLDSLADAVAQNEEPVLQPASRPELASGALNAETIANALGALMPEGAVVSDEGNTSSLFVPGGTAGAPRHDWLTITGGAIGQGLPVATGAAVACPGQRVIALEADGSAMYTLQALWTQARESLDVTTVIFNNRSYAILNIELARVGADAAGPQALAMLDLSNPDLDFVALAQGMGVPATRASTAEEFNDALRRSLAEPGPSLIDAVLS